MAISQEQINQWFSQNPNATPDDIALAVQNAGGLESNPGLAGSIAERYSVPEANVSQYYQTYASPFANTATGITGGLNTANQAVDTSAGLASLAGNQMGQAGVTGAQTGITGGLELAQAPVAQAQTQQPTVFAPVTGTTIGATTTPVDPIFEWFRTHPGATDAEIAEKMRLEKWTPDMVAASTGTQDKVIDYTNRFGIANQAAAKTAAEQALADQNAAYEASARASVAASEKAAADEKERTKFQTVYDPNTGREFISPAQAIQYGVTDYVTEMPMKLEFLNDISKKAVTDSMASGLTFEQALNRLGGQYGMSGKDFYNYEVQGGIRSKDTAPIKEAVATESGGLKPDELIAKLQAFKDKPPTTAQGFAEQRALYADYANRYANSSWNYANMGGKAQDFSLKPSDYLGSNFTGYADPINFALSNMNQMSPEYKEMSKILTANPEINDVIDQLYKLNPNAMMFNSINPKYAGGTEASTMASNFNNTIIKNLAGDIKRYGKDTAMQNFIGQQKNLLSSIPNEQGRLGDFNQTTMSNAQFRELNRLEDQYTPKISDASWANRVKKETGADSSIGNVYRDPSTGKGLAIQFNQRGNAQEVRFIDQQGQGVNVPMNDPAKLLSAFYESGMSPSAFTALQKAAGSEYLIPPPKAEEKQYFLPALQNGVKFSDFANGNAAKVLASDGYLKDVQNRALADYQWSIKNGTPANSAELELQRTVEKAVNDQKIAKSYLADSAKADAAKAATKATSTKDTNAVVEAPVGVTDKSAQGLKSLAATTFGDQSLSSWEQTNKVMKAAQEAGVNDAGLQQIFGKDVADKYIGQYGAGLKDFVSKTLDKSEGTTFDEIATIKQEARKYNISPQEFAKYSGMDPKQAGAMFGAYDTGLANLVKGWQKADADAGTDKDALAKAAGNKIKTFLALEQQYGVTADDMAKAYGGNVTAKDVNDYIQPVKEAPQKIQALIGDTSLSGADIRNTLKTLQDDPRIQGIYGAALSKLNDMASQDYSGKYGNKNYESLNPIAVNNVLSQLKAQQDAGTAQYYQGGAKGSKDSGFGSLDKVTEDMAKNLVAAGITDIRQVGQKTITTKDEDGNDVTRTEIVNKVTGEPITKASNYAERTTGNSWSGTFKGDGNTGYNVQFKDGNPIFYTTGASSSDMKDLAPILAMASFIPGAAPFVAGINALAAAKEGNWKQAILSALPVGGEIAKTLGASASTVANIGTASKLARVADAIDRKDLLGTVMSGVGAASDSNLFGDGAFNPNEKLFGNFTTKGLLGDVSMLKALKDKDLSSLLNIGAQMSGSKDAVTAAKGITLIKALQSDNPFAIASAIQKMNLTQDTLGKASGGLAALPA
jgi:hypothetical protein